MGIPAIEEARMNGYRFDLRCVHCPGVELAHITAGRTTTTQTGAIARCPECLIEYLITVHLTHVREAPRPLTAARRAQLGTARQKSRDALVAIHS